MRYKHRTEGNRKEKQDKDLKLEIQRMWQMKTEVIPVVVGALGTVKKGMVEYIKKASEKATVTEAKKIYMLELHKSSGMIDLSD